jgi:hypothetical protein
MGFHLVNLADMFLSSCVHLLNVALRDENTSGIR